MTDGTFGQDSEDTGAMETPVIQSGIEFPAGIISVDADGMIITETPFSIQAGEPIAPIEGAPVALDTATVTDTAIIFPSPIPMPLPFPWRDPEPGGVRHCAKRQCTLTIRPEGSDTETSAALWIGSFRGLDRDCEFPPRKTAEEARDDVEGYYIALSMRPETEG